MPSSGEYKFGTSVGFSSAFVESYSVSESGDTADVKDEKGKLKARAHFGFKKEASVSIVCKGSVPAVGSTFNIGEDQYTVTSCEETGSNSDFVKASVKGVSYGHDGGLTPTHED
jgi:hypothetical protein